MKEIKKFLQENNYEWHENEPLKKYLNYRVGGNADILVFPNNVDQLETLTKLIAKSPYKSIVLGKGSNVLVSDLGIRGIVIKLDKLDNIEQIDETTFRLDAGVNLVPVSIKFAKLGLSGMEFASGIPGQIGGAIYMNAGAHGSDMSKILTQVTTITHQGKIKVYSQDSLNFRYRYSDFQENEEIIISCVVKLKQDNVAETKERIKLFRTVRTSKQPYDLPSCGSVFRNPDNLFAGELVELCGLKGYKIGGAQVSNKHANFIVNTGDAKARDIYDLMMFVKDEVSKRFDINLENECILINF